MKRDTSQAEHPSHALESGIGIRKEKCGMGVTDWVIVRVMKCTP